MKKGYFLQSLCLCFWFSNLLTLHAQLVPEHETSLYIVNNATGEPLPGCECSVRCKLSTGEFVVENPNGTPTDDFTTKAYPVGSILEIFWTGSKPIGVQPSGSFNWSRQGTRVDFSPSISGSLTHCAWNFGDGGNSVELTPSHDFVHPGTYMVSLIVFGPECTHTTQISSEVIIPNPNEPFLEPFENGCECQGADSIRAPRYTYAERFFVRADELPIYKNPRIEIVDTVDQKPEIRWDIRNTPSTHQIAVITRTRPHFSMNGNILDVNIGDWMWTSAMVQSQDLDGKVKFEDGKQIVDFTDQHAPVFGNATPLEVGEIYYWLVYAFTEDGTRIGACTRVHPFIVQ